MSVDGRRAPSTTRPSSRATATMSAGRSPSYGHAAGLDHEHARVAVDAAHVAEREDDEARPPQRDVRVGDGRLERLEPHRRSVPARARRPAGSRPASPRPPGCPTRGTGSPRGRTPRPSSVVAGTSSPTTPGPRSGRVDRLAARHRAASVTASTLDALGEVRGLDRVHERPALEREAAADRVDARVRRGHAAGHVEVERDDVARRATRRVDRASRSPGAQGRRARRPPSRPSRASAQPGTRRPSDHGVPGASATVTRTAPVPRVVGLDREPHLAAARGRPDLAAGVLPDLDPVVVGRREVLRPARERADDVGRAAGAGVPRLALARAGLGGDPVRPPLERVDVEEAASRRATGPRARRWRSSAR